MMFPVDEDSPTLDDELKLARRKLVEVINDSSKSVTDTIAELENFFRLLAYDEILIYNEPLDEAPPKENNTDDDDEEAA